VNAEEKRIEEMTGTVEGWRLWGPYLAERAWGTVREDTSQDGSAWESLSHDDSRRRAYRWSEDGLGGICDLRQLLCFAPTFWNGRDPILKERLFGLTGPEGNHGEDVKEVYFYTDATPSHSYLKFVYHYPQSEFPYEDLVKTNHERDRTQWEYELWDTEIFNQGYWKISIEYAKASHDDISIRILAENCGPRTETLHVLPTLWLRNRWGDKPPPPALRALGPGAIEARHERLGTYRLTTDSPTEVLFTENVTGRKDAFHQYLIHNQRDALNAESVGTKAAFVQQITAQPGKTGEVWLRLSEVSSPSSDPQKVRTQRQAESMEFYDNLAPQGSSPDEKQVLREALSGLIWSKQFYRYDLSKPRENDRNDGWETLHAADVLAMPDTWEYPWFAAWDSAFHAIPYALIDPEFAKHQLLLLCREWYMHPSGQLPAYEWNFSDVNPPVHAWAALRVYKIEKKRQGKSRNQPGDLDFLEKIFHKLLINFTWWVNQKDQEGNNAFEGGFLGLDNIGVFDRSAPLPGGGLLEQCDGTAWMAMYALNLLAIALELARYRPAYEDVALKFAEHFCYIAHALNGLGLWDEEDGFYYDVLHLPGQGRLPLKVRSIVGLIPLFAVEVIDADVLQALPGFTERLRWFLTRRPELARDAAHLGDPAQQGRAIFSLVGPERLRRILNRILDPEEFLSPHGVRSLSKFHESTPYIFPLDPSLTVKYTPAESETGMFGGNSNWRGPLWMPINYLLIESLQKFDFAYGESFLYEGKDLWAVASDLSERLISLFLRDSNHKRPCFGITDELQDQPHVLFHEYFHADNGAGLGASHQTGWTALVAKLLMQSR
jgi:hypothetical protein